jgi:iron(III) transport system permease protein
MSPAFPRSLTGPPSDAQAPVPRRRGPRRAERVHPVVWVPAVLVAMVMLLPATYLVLQASELGGAEIRDLVTDPETLRLAGRTLLLAGAVTLACLVIAVPVAWVTVRSDLPARRFFAVATALPLVVPSFVGAFAIIAALAPGGLVEAWLGVRPPSPYGFWGAFAALTLFSYPYVLLTVQGSLRGVDPSLEEASRSLGHGALATFWRVTVPQLRPAAAAGSLLVALYVLSDFGAVSMLRYSTFTRAIYLQYRSAFDRAPAAVLGLMLVALTVVVLVLEARAARDRGGQFRMSSSARRAQVVPLGRWRWPAAALCALLLVVALALPLAVMGYWLVRGLSAGEPLQLALGAAGRSLQASALGAVVAVAVAMPVAIWAARSRSWASRVVDRVSFTGYALPGIVVALALVYLGVRAAPWMYQSMAMLVFAYVVLFVPQAIGSIRSSLLQVSPSVDEAARTLGSSPLQVLRRVLVPLGRRGAIAGGGLVFLTAMKELPATLLLAPTGFDTLAVRVWSATTEAFFARAAAPALLLVALGSLPLAIAMVRERGQSA